MQYHVEERLIQDPTTSPFQEHQGLAKVVKTYRVVEEFGGDDRKTLKLEWDTAFSTRGEAQAEADRELGVLQEGAALHLRELLTRQKELRRVERDVRAELGAIETTIAQVLKQSMAVVQGAIEKAYAGEAKARTLPESVHDLGDPAYTPREVKS